MVSDIEPAESVATTEPASSVESDRYVPVMSFIFHGFEMTVY